MIIEKVGQRSVLFTFNVASEWDLNIHLILGKKQNYLIDTGLGSNSVAHVLRYIKDAVKPLVVINTHHHWDHIWGNSTLRDCMILSHSLCAEMIETKWETMIQKHDRYMDGETEKCVPNKVMDSEFFFPEDRIRLLHSPGHTADSISVLDEEDGILNAGDNIGDTMDEIIPSLDCSHETYLNTLAKYQGLDINTVLSGHNACLGKDVLQHIQSRL